METRLYLHPKDLERFNKSNIVGEGCFGKVYRYDKDSVIKLWNSGIYDKESFRTVSRLCNVSYEFNNIILPKRMVFIKEKFLRPSKAVGYISPYFDGIELEKVYENLNYHKYMKALYELEKDIILFTQMTKYYIRDLNSRNILAKLENDEVLLALIDCDDWTRSNKSFEEIKNKNIIKFTDSVMGNLIYRSPALRSFINRDDNLKRLMDTSFLSVEDLHEFLNLAKLRLEDYSNQEIKKIGDFKKALTRR